jgi:hypothetical protein
MKPRNLMGLMVVGIILPMTVITAESSVLASEVKVKTPNVEAVTSRDGSIYLNSNGTIVQVPSRSSYRSWHPFRYWRLPWQNNNNVRSNCRHSSYQATSHVTPSSSSIVQSSISHNTCN